MKLLILGMDCLDYDLCRRYGLLKRGDLKILHSAYQATVSSWTSIYTGLTRHVHGVGYGWRDWLFNQVPTVRIDSEGKDPPIYPIKYKELPLIWKDINALGLSVSLFGMPLTFPPPRIDGWVVSGFPCLMDPKKITHPISIALLIKNYSPDIFQFLDPKFISHFHYIRKRHHEAFFERGGMEIVVKLLRNRLANLTRIWIKYPTDVAFIGFSFVDHVGHLAVTNQKQQKAIYQLAEWVMEETIDLIKPEKIMVVSDHGGQITTPETRNGVDYKYFDHTARGVIYVEGDTLEKKRRHEYHVKEEMLRLLK